jgi:hypothetical protein
MIYTGSTSPCRITEAGVIYENIPVLATVATYICIVNRKLTKNNMEKAKNIFLPKCCMTNNFG